VQHKLASVLATDEDAVPILEEETPFELDPRDVMHGEFPVDLERNPKGRVLIRLRRDYGQAVLYLSETAKRPSALNHSAQSNVSHFPSINSCRQSTPSTSRRRTRSTLR
jgi:hypothetical protein